MPSPPLPRLSVTVLLTVLAGVLSALAAILGNLATSTIPLAIIPYLRFAWPVLGAVLLLGIGVSVWQVRRDTTVVRDQSLTPVPLPDLPGHPDGKQLSLANGEDHLEHSHIPHHSPVNEKQSTFVVPRMPNPSFQGRPFEFATLSKLFFEESLPASPPSASPLIVGFVGMGGIGKTELAVQLAYHYQAEKRFPAGIFWLSMSGSTSTTGITIADLQLLFAELWDKSGIPLSDNDGSKLENERERAYQMGRYLAHHPDALLILDNLDLIESAEPLHYLEKIDTLFRTWLPSIAGESFRCAILYTSRYQEAPLYVNTYTVAGLSKEGAWRLLLEQRPTLLNQLLAGDHSREAEAARAICAYVEYLPLALILLREFLRDPHLTLVHLWEEQRRRGTIDLTTRFGQDVMKAKLFRTFEQSWEKISLPYARTFFKLAVHFPEATFIPLWLVGLASGLSGETSLEPLGEASEELQRWSLITIFPEKNFIGLHPLLREFGQIIVQSDSERFLWLAEADNYLIREFNDFNQIKARIRAKGYKGCLDDVQVTLNYAHLLSVEPAIVSLEQVEYRLLAGFLEKIRQCSTSLRDYPGNPILRRGIITGYNEAFVIDQTTRNQLIAEDAQSSDLLKPFLAGQDIRRYAINFQERYLIWTYRGVPIDQYPAIYKHLQQYQAQLEKRPRAGKAWWELPLYYRADFEKSKIIFPSIATENRFALEREGCYLNSNVSFLPIDDLYLLAVLNSHILSVFFKFYLPSFRNGYLDYRTSLLADIPIRCVNFSTSAKDRNAYSKEAERLYQRYLDTDNDASVLGFVTHHLSQDPESSDIVHDLLAYLAQEMVRLNKEKQALQNDFLSYLSKTLHTPEKDGKAGLGTLNGRSRLFNYPGEYQQEELFLSLDELWDIIGTNLSTTLKNSIQAQYDPNRAKIEPLKKQLKQIDTLIDQIVYRLYGLTEEERVFMEEDKKPRS